MPNKEIKKHQPKYFNKAYQNYSKFDLSDGIRFFVKRSTHRKTLEKAKKDLYDAKNYIYFLELKLKEELNHA